MASKDHLERMIEQSSLTAEINIGLLWDRMRNEFLVRWDDLQRQGLGEAEMTREMQAFMDSLSSKPVEELARRSSGVAYNQGRAAEILTRFDKGEIEFVVRSEILDGDQCPQCEALDGQVFEVNTPEFNEFMPPAKCLGGANCRGFYVAFSGGG